MFRTLSRWKGLPPPLFYTPSLLYPLPSEQCVGGELGSINLASLSHSQEVLRPFE